MTRKQAIERLESVEKKLAVAESNVAGMRRDVNEVLGKLKGKDDPSE